MIHEWLSYGVTASDFITWESQSAAELCADRVVCTPTWVPVCAWCGGKYTPWSHILWHYKLGVHTGCVCVGSWGTVSASSVGGPYKRNSKQLWNSWKAAPQSTQTQNGCVSERQKPEDYKDHVFWGPYSVTEHNSAYCPLAHHNVPGNLWVI